MDGASSIQHAIRALEDHAAQNPLRFPSLGRMSAVDVQILPHYSGPHPGEQFLTPARKGDAGLDLYSAQKVILRPGERQAIPTGLCFAVPDGYEMQVRPKSGLALNKGFSIVNTPGTVDSGYRGEVMVIAVNTNPAVNDEVMDALFEALDGTKDIPQAHESYDLYRNEATIIIEAGTKIAQIVYARFERPVHRVVTELTSSERGTGGFGSTGA